MTLVLNVTAQTNVSNGAVKMILANEQGEVVAAGRSWGRKGPGDSEEPRQLAFDRLLNQLVKLGVSSEDIKAATFNFTETTVESATAGQPKTKVSISLAGLMSGEVKVEPKAKKAPAIPVNKPEGNVTAANLATGTDNGLITPATNRPAYVETANTAIQTVDQLNATLAEEGLEVTGGRANVNMLMESGSVGGKAIGAYRQDSNGAPMIQQVRAEVVDPSVRPIEAREQTSLSSINARKGAAPLVSRPVVSGAWLADKATSKRKAQGTAERSELDPIANETGRLFATDINLALAFGNGTDLESMTTGRAKAESLKAQGAASLNKRLVGQLAWRLGFLVGCARQGIMPASPCNGFMVALLQFGINFSQDANGQPLVNGRPVTWDLELAGAANKAVNG